MKTNLFTIMKKAFYIFALSVIALPAAAQTEGDSTQIDRTVYVEREFQPTVQQAGKIAVKPQVYEPQLVLQDPVYSDFNKPISMDYNVRQLDFSTLNFCHREPMHGFMRIGGGYANSLFDFNYRVTDSQMQKRKKQSANDLILDLHAHHLGQWGRKALSESTLGLDFSKQFSGVELFFGAEGGNDFFTRYGVYFDPASASTFMPGIDRYKHIAAANRQMLWSADTKIGVKSLPNADVKYLVQTGYEAFIAPQFAIEHQVHTQGMFEWSKNFHTIGAELELQDRLYSVQDTSAYTRANHKIHIEPYYAYEGNRFHVHAGVNLDFSAGRGRVAGISPNVHFEANLTKTWLAAYVHVGGEYAANGARGEYAENRYRSLACLFVDTLSGEYKPIDMDFGFKIRPYETLLIDLHAGYAYTIDQHVNVFSKEVYGMFEHELQNTSCWKVGATLHYHWRDILFLNASGNYYARKAKTAIGGLTEDFDEPVWDARLRIEGKINQKWSLYSDNYFAGTRNACVYDGAAYQVKEMRPMFDLNLGLQYNINRWWSVYAQLNNYLAWTEKLSYMTFYGHEAQRANCMVGFSCSF